MATNVKHVYAVGECTEHRGVVYGLVAPLFEQGKVLAGRLCGQAASPYEGPVVYTKLKVSGINVFSAGEFLDGPDKQALRVMDEWSGTYRKVLIKDNRVVGAVLFGDTQDAQRFV